jgi:hypothetical protein
MPIPVQPTYNLHSLANWTHGSLGVVCTACDHRKSFSQKRLDAYLGNMRLLTTLKFVCGFCGQRRFDMFILTDPADEEYFLHPPASGPSF